MVYYNELDPKIAAWLRQLISDGVIADGHVDTRSIVDVSANDLKGYDQHHFFAGIGGWSCALRLAQWPDNIPVWTASLPCQPFSAAGKGLGKEDERHLLPHFLELVKKCRPHRIFGEQVERAIGHGWLDDLQTTMESEDYAVGYCVLGAHSVGAAHIRQRLYWVADSQCTRLERFSGNGNDCDQPRWINPEQSGSIAEAGIVGCGLGDTARNNKRRQRESGASDGREESLGGSGVFGRVGISDSPGSQQRIEAAETARYGCAIEPAGSDDIQWIYCRDGKYRPTKPGILPLVNGVSRGMVRSSDPNNTQEARSIRLKGYGNAIVPQLAAEFITAWKLSTIRSAIPITGC